MFEKLFKAAPAAIIIAALALMLMLGRNILDDRLPVIGGNYYKDFKSDCELEYKYSQMGPHDVDSYEKESGEETGGTVTVWYPKDMGDEKVPMIIVANPSQVKQSQYKAFFSRLASWGFVVVGNEDPQSGNGVSTAYTLKEMMELVETHPLREVIDYDRIGVVGYSQGGAGALAAASDEAGLENGKEFKAIFTGSAIEKSIADSYGWKYDLSKIKIPYFMVAGTGEKDSGTKDEQGLAPFNFLMDSYDTLGEDITKIRARATGADHSDMMLKSDGYMTAWMLWQLSGDEEAAKAFKGTDAEILNNSNWQDIEKTE